MPGHTHNQPRNNGDNNQPRGTTIEIPKVTDQQIWAAGGSVNMHPGHITGR
jgi:hypothetical protein